VVLVGLGMVFPGLAMPVFNQIFLDDIFTGKHSDWMFNLCIAMTIAFFLSEIMNVRRKVTDLTMKIQQDYGKEYGTVMNGLLMIESIKANGNEADFFAKWAGYRAKVLAGMQEVQLYQLGLTILPSLLTGLNTAIIITLGGFSIMEGSMTAGIFMAFQNLMTSFQEPFNRFLALGSTLQQTEMQMRRIDDVERYPIDSLNYPEENDMKFQKERLSGKIELKNLNFGYSPLEPPLLEDFNLTVEPGRWVAIVGFSGSGKSTLSKIVTGLYQEWSGEVLFDGTNRRSIPRNIIVNSLSSVGCVGKIEQKKHKQFFDKMSLKEVDNLCQIHFTTKN